MKYNRFASYNYGRMMENWEAYNQFGAPQIPITNSKIPTAIFVSRHDKIATVEDNLKLSKTIQNNIHFEILEEEDHSSVIFSKNMTYFKSVLEVMNQ